MRQGRVSGGRQSEWPALDFSQKAAGCGGCLDPTERRGGPSGPSQCLPIPATVCLPGNEHALSEGSWGTDPHPAVTIEPSECGGFDGIGRTSELTGRLLHEGRWHVDREQECAGLPVSQLSRDMNRNLFYPFVLAGALGMPVLLVNDRSEQPFPMLHAEGQVPAGLAAYPVPGPTTAYYPGNALGPDLSAPPLQFMPIQDLGQVIRFDWTPEMITQRWERVSVIEEGDGLRGLRVAFVSGVNATDIHGSLTFYFDPSQVLQRIGFRGWTGDPAAIVSLVQNGYQMQPRRSSLSGCYISSSWGRTKGMLLLKPPAVIRAELPQQRMAILLDLVNPRGNAQVSEEAARHLQEATRQ